MRIAVLSGKGGTGKTLVSVNLAAIADKSIYIDCDVEEPNGHLFFQPNNVTEREISVKIPMVDTKRCNGCKKCVSFCKFNALAYIKEKLIFFHEICHSCGGCILFCPQNALSEKEKVIGTIHNGISENVKVKTGILNTGEVSGVPIIKELMKESGDNQELIFIDCPPGSACGVMESIQDADFCILVVEPTLFGVHNLNMVYELVKLFHKPFGAIINKYLTNDNPAEDYCKEKAIPILGRIPFDEELGKLNSDGKIVVRHTNKYRHIFSDLLCSVIKEVQSETIVNP